MLKPLESATGWNIVASDADAAALWIAKCEWLKKLKFSYDEWASLCGDRYVVKIATGYVRSLGEEMLLRTHPTHPGLLKFSGVRSKFRSGTFHTVYFSFLLRIVEFLA